MKTLLTITAILEAAVGVAILAAPSALADVLLGAPLDSPAAQAVARLAGAALISLGVVCWLARAHIVGRAARGVVSAMLLYNVAAVAILAYAGLGAGLSGIGLWPAVLLHAALAVWCVASLRTGPATTKK